MRNVGIGLVCLLFSISPAAADQWDEAVMAFDTQRYEDVMDLLAPLAQPGNVAAQLLLIDTYVRGESGLTDDARFEWARRGAELGIAPAQDQMAQYYMQGEGVAVDVARAARWFELAADQWYAPAVYNFGVLTMNGQGVPANPGYAVGLFHRAAELNEPYALYVLGGMYLEGVYVDYNMDYGLPTCLKPPTSASATPWPYWESSSRTKPTTKTVWSSPPSTFAEHLRPDATMSASYWHRRSPTFRSKRPRCWNTTSLHGSRTWRRTT